MEAAAPLTVPYTWPRIAVVNDPNSGVPDADARLMTDAVAYQVLHDFGPRWHQGAHFTFVPAGHRPPAGCWVVALLSTSDEAGALGYHDLTPEGLPLGKVFAATDRQYGQNVAVTLGHEVLEMLADPWIDLCAQSADGKFYALEVADAVEADGLGYRAPNGVVLSAFVTPAWFGHGAGAVSFPQGRVSRPFELAPGGYISVFDPASGQGWQQQSADAAPLAGISGVAAGAEYPVVGSGGRLSAREQALAVPRVGSRRERRFRGRDGWVHSTFELDA